MAATLRRKKDDRQEIAVAVGSVTPLRLVLHRGLDGSLKGLFLVNTPLDLTTFLSLLGNTARVVDPEADQLLSLVGGLNQATTDLSDTAPVSYFGSRVWDG